MRKITAHIFVLGPPASGKHSLIYRLCHNRLDEIPAFMRKDGCMFFSTSYEITSEYQPTTMTLDFHVRSSQLRRNVYNESLINNAQAVIFTIDATQPEKSFASAAVEITQRQKLHKKTPWFLVVTRCEALSEQALTALSNQYRPLAEAHNLEWIMPTSATTGLGMEALRHRLSLSLFQKRVELKLSIEEPARQLRISFLAKHKAKDTEETPLVCRSSTTSKVNP